MKLFNWLFNRSRPNAYGREHWPVSMGTSGNVNVTHESALMLASVWRAVRLISQTVAGLPFHVQRIEGDKRERLRSHPIDKLISCRPNEEQTAFEFWEAIISWALTYGNGYALIERDGRGQPYALYPIGPEDLDPKRDAAGNLVYVQSTGDAVWDAADVFHLKGPGWNGLKGCSVIHYARTSLSVGLSADQFGSSFFSNGMTLGNVLEHPDQLSTEAMEKLKEQMKQFRGSRNAFKTFIAEEGMTIKPMGIPAKDAQWLESRKFSVNDVARWFGVPPHKLMDLDRATFSNIEHQAIEFVTDAILPWVLRLEQQANFKLFGIQQQTTMRTKMNMQGLLRGDQTARSDFYQKLWSMGVLSVNDILKLEDMNPIGKDGDKRLVQLNLTTLQRAGEEPVKPEPAPVIEPESVPDEVEEMTERIQRRETARAEQMKDATPERLRQWREKFSAEHRHYMRNKLIECMNSVAKDHNLDPGPAHWVIDFEAQSRAAVIAQGGETECPKQWAKRVYSDCMIAIHLKAAS